MSPPRGQNLVLLALTMLFLALMVTMTIGLGLRIRQKQELQNLADAAAFSNSVMTARAFNNMALVNRLEVSYWVALAADESLISWTAYAKAIGAATAQAADELPSAACFNSQPNRAQAERDLNAFAGALRSFVSTQIRGPGNAAWRNADREAGKEARAIQGQIAGLRSELSDGVVTNNPGDLQNRLYTAIGVQQLTNQIIAASRQTEDVSIIKTGMGANPNTAAKLTRQELDCDYGASGNPSLTGAEPGGAGLCLRGSWSENMLSAAMGTRGSSFLTGRSQIPPKILNEIARLDASYGRLRVNVGSKSGSAYWAASMTHGKSPNGTEAWGDDHGSVSVSVGNCTGPAVDAVAFVRSTHLDNDDDQHQWNPGSGEDPEPDQDHTMGDCSPLCPSVWVRTIGFQPNGSPEDAWGQPKIMVALQRDLSARSFPWELQFRFPFSATGPAAEWDGRGQRLHTRVGNNLNISTQTAFATGIAYYHRRGHWNEFPNLLNPFWRATLAPVDVDERPRDVNRALSSPQYKWQRDAWDALRAAGFQGLH